MRTIVSPPMASSSRTTMWAVALPTS